MGKLIIERFSDKADSLRPYDIYLNDNKVGKINNLQDFSINLVSGKYTVFLKIDWCETKKLNIDMTNNNTVFLETGSFFNMYNPLSILRIFFKYKYIYLKILNKSYNIKNLNKSEIDKKNLKIAIKNLKIKTLYYYIIFNLISFFTIRNVSELNKSIDLLVSLILGVIFSFITYFIYKQIFINEMNSTN